MSQKKEIGSFEIETESPQQSQRARESENKEKMRKHKLSKFKNDGEAKKLMQQ